MKSLNKEEEKMIKLLEFLEKVDFENIQFNLVLEKKEYKVSISKNSYYREKSDDKEERNTTQIKIETTDGNERVFKREYEDRWWLGTKIHYDCYEKLLNGSYTKIEGYGDNSDNAFNSIKKYQEQEIGGKKVTFFYDESTEFFKPFQIENLFFKKNKSTIKVKDKKNARKYYYNTDIKDYFFGAKNDIIPLKSIEESLNNIAVNLESLNESIDKLKCIFSERKMSDIIESYQKISAISDEKKEIIETVSKIKEIIPKDYFTTSLKWTDFNNHTLESINKAIKEKITECIVEKNQQRLDEMIASLSEEELQYVLKKYKNTNISES